MSTITAFLEDKLSDIMWCLLCYCLGVPCLSRCMTFLHVEGKVCHSDAIEIAWLDRSLGVDQSQSLPTLGLTSATCDVGIRNLCSMLRNR